MEMYFAEIYLNIFRAKISKYYVCDCPVYNFVACYMSFTHPLSNELLGVRFFHCLYRWSLTAFQEVHKFFVFQILLHAATLVSVLWLPSLIILKRLSLFLSVYCSFQVFPIRHLEIFTEDELECLLCGEQELWNVCIFTL